MKKQFIEEQHKNFEPVYALLDCVENYVKTSKYDGGAMSSRNLCRLKVENLILATEAEIRKRVEGMKKDEVKWKKAKYDVKSVDAVLYNRALDDIISTLTTEKV